MPQTLEAISHAKAAPHVKIMVAINKIDLPSANLDRVKKQLQERELSPEDWGGDTIVCEVSATKGTGIDHLLEMMALQAEVMELKASPTATARGTVIEAQVEPGRGPTATVIVQMGTLRTGDPFICGDYGGKIKSLMDDRSKPIKEAGPSTPVKILGFSGLPQAGDEFLVMESERSAKTLSEERLLERRADKLSVPQRATLESLLEAADGKKHLRIVLKCDAQGSLEALSGAQQPGTAGFDAVIGNPPYIRIQTMKEWAPIEVEHYKRQYISASKGNYDIYVVFVERGFDAMRRERTEAVILAPDTFYIGQRRQYAELALKNRMPTMFPFREQVEAGGLMSYGQNLAEHYRRAASYVDRILKGARPGELPIEQPTKLHLAINRKTAKALGLTVPPSIELRADEVIE
jgi:hypothetical protein